MRQAGVPQRLAGKVAIVTGGGGTNSIGRSICLRLAAEGAKVGVVDLDGAKAALVTEEIRTAGGEALPVVCDVSRLEDCEAAAKALADAWDCRSTRRRRPTT